MKADYGEMLSNFIVAMDVKLKKNAWKDPWYNCSLQYLSMRLTQERKELCRALKFDDPKKVLEEAADVANFAMMLADVYRRITEEKNGTANQ